MARPDMINETYVKKAQEYVDGAWKADGSVVPTVEGMAIYLDISRKTCYQAEELSHTLEQVQRLQASLVLNKGLTGEYNSNIAKLLLSSKHGYVEKQEIDQKSSDGSMSPKANKSDVDAMMDLVKQSTAKAAEDA